MTEEFAAKPRADITTIASGDEIHDQWTLHSFAFETENDWMPAHLRCYHPDRMMNGELMEGYYDEFVPVIYDSPRGNVLRKQVTEQTLYCDECDEPEPARKIDTGEPVCPECGLICDHAGPTYEIINDPKATGRIIID